MRLNEIKFRALINFISNRSVIENDVDFAGYLIDQALVAVVPGVAFGCPNHVRISYVVSMASLEMAMDRMAVAISCLK